jgi:NADP-dependent 3-hydroxy acid dehydrogenase YdfG/acyl carrier protein
LRGTTRWTLEYDAVDVAAGAAAAPIRDGDVWIIAGGFGTIGLTAARALAAQARVRLVLLARHARPDDPRIAELEAAGAGVLALACDIEDPTALRAALDRARQHFGPIDGVVHAAGPTGAATFRALSDIDADYIASQFGAKVRGLLALSGALEATGDAAPATIVLASSLAAPLGGLGFAAYAAANAVMDAVAVRAARGSGRRRWLSVNWDGWSVDGSPVAGAIDAGAGGRAFAQLLTHDAGPQVLAVVGDLDARLARWINPGTNRQTAPESQAPAPPRLPRTRPTALPVNDVEHLVVAAIADLLGVLETDLDDNFFDLGGHSLLATQLVSRLRRTFMIDVPLRVVFDQPTARAIAAAIVAGEPKAGQAMATAQLRRRLGSLSADEARAMLAARQAGATEGSPR